ncbi:hypothetical protein AK812_SmicGene42730 [Symbiodinium microadriaticum]|uniref:Uncharacterized protein n=1 Tax=Symbiodinium microadriaticum TaxID=2951 RepID=A0A1Q9C2U5_SYMMI|nr:hypothetical protein AK812_SmicGene42730 [Symbiodinium microadriaticum]
MSWLGWRLVVALSALRWMQRPELRADGYQALLQQTVKPQASTRTHPELSGSCSQKSIIYADTGMANSATSAADHGNTWKDGVTCTIPEKEHSLKLARHLPMVQVNLRRGSSTANFAGGGWVWQRVTGREAVVDPVLLSPQVCPQFTCYSEGSILLIYPLPVSKCQWSVSEIRDAVGNGATGVVDQVTAVAAKVPGLADAAGAAGPSMWLAAPDMWVFAGASAGTRYGSCQCKPGFCAKDGGLAFSASAQ